MTKPLSPDEVNELLGLEFDIESWIEAWVRERLAANRARAQYKLMTGNGTLDES